MISRYVLMLTLALLVVYMVSTFITLLWLACPFYGNLARFMANYQVAIVVYTLQVLTDTQPNILLGGYLNSGSPHPLIGPNSHLS